MGRGGARRAAENPHRARRASRGPAKSPASATARCCASRKPATTDEHVRYTGRVIKIIDRAKQRVLGIFRALPDGGGRLVPVDKKQLGRELAIPPAPTGDAQDGDLVAVERRAARPASACRTARVEERLGSLKSEKAVSLIAIHAHGIPHVFPPAVLDGGRGRAARRSSTAARTGASSPLVTIDPADAKDHDDAVHAEPDADPNNPGGYIVTVAIADVAALRAARLARSTARRCMRGNSVYFPDRVVPMLPERISNDLCSLRPTRTAPRSPCAW